jgi:hypothetical protein
MHSICNIYDPPKKKSRQKSPPKKFKAKTKTKTKTKTKQKTKVKASKIKQNKKVTGSNSSMIPQHVRFFVVVLGGVVFRFPSNLEKNRRKSYFLTF